MAAEIVFGDGAKSVRVPGLDAHGLMQNLERVSRGGVQTPTGPLPAGGADVETGEGVIYVNPAQVAYVRDIGGQESVAEQMSATRPAQVRANP